MGERVDGPEMYDWMWVVAERHQDPKNILEMKTSSHTTKLRVNTPKCSCIARSRVGLAIRYDLIYQIVDLGRSKRVARAVAKSAQSFSSNVANVWIWEDDE